ncbi:MAG: hypothetical protein R2838_07920 [Caldilineaceae bacterium]
MQHTVCTPSRCSFMTGWYPHVRGHRTLWHLLPAGRAEPAQVSSSGPATTCAGGARMTCFPPPALPTA